ncbi:MAG TPA: PhzF family phenazine biosynthesis isomerase [Acidimicrobiales bacterium]|jgi:trans-2,3-dihydro-3-hydroxyanthranilate isomerase|nr:PhzF family phenazine biosynthesis isomerase [Acidimicrobiales bacterium]
MTADASEQTRPVPELAYKVLDVFSDRAFAGNGLCVVGGILDDTATMQAIARAMNLSETVFVRKTGDWSYDARIFTPVDELPLAGHPSVGAAWSMGPGAWSQRTSGAVVTVEATATGAVMVQPDPIVTEVYPEDAARAMSIPVEHARKAFVADLAGTRHLVVPTDHPLDRVRFDNVAGAAAARAVRATGLAAMRRLDDTTIHVRLAVPTETASFEDPGTGSAAGPIGLLARRLWGMGPDLIVRQGAEIGRPSVMVVHAEEGNLRVGGAVHAFASGVLTF